MNRVILARQPGSVPPRFLSLATRNGIVRIVAFQTLDDAQAAREVLGHQETQIEPFETEIETLADAWVSDSFGIDIHVFNANTGRVDLVRSVCINVTRDTGSVRSALEEAWSP